MTGFEGFKNPYAEPVPLSFSGSLMKAEEFSSTALAVFDLVTL
jgi:hypothetical protein